MDKGLISELGLITQQAMAEFHVPGTAVGIWHAGEEFIAGYGVTNVENPLPVDGDTLFQIGSITKTMTGTAVMRLVEMAKLDLDEPVCTYLPGFHLADESAAARVTLRHCLSHTGGWAGDYFSDTGMGADALALFVAEMANLPQLAPLGEVWAYNNSGFSLAGRVIEVVTGKTFEEALQELVVSPLGLRSSFLFANDAITYRVAVGHMSSDQDPEPQVVRPWALARSAHAAGGIISSARDQIRYARFHLGNGVAEDGTRILSTDSLSAMQRPMVQANLGNEFGITWFLKEIDGEHIVRHGGATLGQLSALLMVPARNFAITVLTNGNRGDEVYEKVTEWVLDRMINIQEAGPQPVLSSEMELASMVGNYHAQLMDMELYLEAGHLMVQVKPKGGFPDKDSPAPPAPRPSQVVFTGKDELLALDPPLKGLRADVIRYPDGGIRWLRTSRLFEPGT